MCNDGFFFSWIVFRVVVWGLQPGVVLLLCFTFQMIIGGDTEGYIVR